MVSEAYSYLVNYSSLIEVMTAMYVSMFIDNILADIWTPSYKESIKGMIDDMKIVGVSVISEKVGTIIDAHSSVIKNHMKRKASFFIVYCLSLLLIAGLEPHSGVLPEYGCRLVFSLSCLALLFMVLGRWTFASVSTVFSCAMVYVLLFIICYFTPILRVIPVMNIASEKTTTCLMLSVLLIPILWQLFIIWVYSSLYQGYMEHKIMRESYLYGRAFLAYRLRNMTALPEQYQLVARDFLNPPVENQDSSLESLTHIVTGRLERICYPPRPLRILISRLKHALHIGRERELEYIQMNGLDHIQSKDYVKKGTLE